MEFWRLRKLIEVQAIIIGCLLWASKQDLESHRVSDLVWIVASGGSMLVTSFLYGFSPVIGMISQGLILLAIGFGLHIFSSFGLADVFALGFIGFSVPGARPLTLASVVLVVSKGYQRVYSRIFNVKAVPLIPGILLGYIFFLLFFPF